MTHVPSYPKVYAVGHAAIPDLFDGPVTVEEKVDGSQFSMMVDDAGELTCRSKGATLTVVEPEKMFAAAVESAKGLAPLLMPGHVYRCEYLAKPKHNALAYDRVPLKHIILFDVETGLSAYLTHEAKAAEAARLGLEVVPLLYRGEVASLDALLGFLARVSCLGGCPIEGVVVKNYSRFARDGKVQMGKYVSERFKEVHRGEWAKDHPAREDVIDRLIDQYRTPARWQKAVQHLREAGNLSESPKDIGPLIKEAQNDLGDECADEIKEALFRHFWPQIRRASTSGLPEWYKQELARTAFEKGVP